MITRSPRTSSKVLILITATLWIARVVELSRALTLRIIFPCWWTQVCRRPSASLDDSQRRLAERAGCILLPIHTHTPSLGFSPGLVSRPSSKFRGRKPGLCLPLEFCPNFSVFSFFWGGAPHHAKSTLFSTPSRNFGGVRRERGRKGEAFILFSEVGVVEEVLSNGRTAAKKTGTEASGTEAP